MATGFISAMPLGYLEWREEGRPEPDPVCPGCGENFIRRGPDDRRVYCSYLCKRGAVMPEGAMEQATCDGCGELFWRAIRKRGSKQLYCSDYCRHKAFLARRKKQKEAA